MRVQARIKAFIAQSDSVDLYSVAKFVFCIAAVSMIAAFAVAVMS